MCQRPGVMGWCYSQPHLASWWPPGRGMGGMLLLVCQAPAQVWPPRWCWLWRLWAACRHSSGQLTCSKLTRGGLFHGGHVDPCPAPVCAVQCARVGGPLGKHRTSAPLVAADQRARQRTRREARSRQSGRRSRPGQTEGKSKRRRKEPLEAHGRPGTQLSLWMPPPGQAREAARRVFRTA